MKHLLHKANCRRFLKERMAHHDLKFSGISKDFWPAMEKRVEALLNEAIVQNPVVRKRLKIVPDGFLP